MTQRQTHVLGASNPNDNIVHIYPLTYCKALKKFHGVSQFSFAHHSATPTLKGKIPTTKKLKKQK